MKHERVHSKPDEIAHVCTCFNLSVHTLVHTKAGVHTRGDLHSVGIWKLARPGPPQTRYVAETFRRRKDGEEWALEMERNIDRNGSSKPRTVRKVRTFGALSRIGRDGLCPGRPLNSCDARSEKSNRRGPQNRSASPSFAPLTSRPSAATCESPCCRPPVASPADCQPVNRAYRPDCEKDWCGHKHASPSRARPAWLRHPDPHQDR